MFVCPAQQKDGFGSQFQNIIAGILFAELNKLEYVHRPITEMEHNYDNDPLFIKRINDHMNINTKYKIYEEYKKKFPNKQQHKLTFFKNFLDKNAELCFNSETMKNIKKNYFLNKLQKIKIFEANIIHITIHIRRQNSHDCRASPNYDNLYLNKMKKLHQKYIKLNLKHHFHIESQGKIENFEKFTSCFENITLHLNDLPEISFYRMVLSDVLMTNVSSFSYTAALLSDGIIFYKKFWHNPMPKWKILD